MLYEVITEGVLTTTIDRTDEMKLVGLASDVNKISEMLNSYIREISQVLAHLSAGDLMVKQDSSLSYKGDFIPIKNALVKIRHSMDSTFHKITDLVITSYSIHYTKLYDNKKGNLLFADD